MEQRLARVSPPPRVETGRIDDSSTLGEVARAALARQIEVVRAHRLTVIAGDDPEGVHDLRVAVRRIRAVVRTFADGFPVEVARCRDDLSWIGGTLGELRDLDVLIARIVDAETEIGEAERAGLRVAVAVLEERRGRARADALAALDSKRFDHLMSALAGQLRRGPGLTPAARAPIADAGLDILHRLHRKVRVLGDDVDDATPAHVLHALRIRAKRLRYGIEFLAPVYGDTASAYAKRVVTLQNVLGAHQDATTSIEALRDVARALGDDPVAAFAIGRLAERSARAARDARARFPKAYRRVCGKRWRRLRARMDAVRSRQSDG